MRPSGIPINGDFERLSFQGLERPWGWTATRVAPEGRSSLDTRTLRSGRHSLRIERSSESGTAPAAEQTLQHWIPPRFAQGAVAQVTLWARRDGGSGHALFVVQAWGDSILADSVVIENTGEAWERFTVAVDVDSSAHSLVLQTTLIGTGSVWFDDIEVTAEGRAWNEVPLEAPLSETAIEWLTERSRALHTVDVHPPPDADSRDLDAFFTIVGDAKVVALGEATHGTSEFFRLKHRLLTALVERSGFRVFAIEANQLVTERINRYVLGGPGDADSVMSVMFRVWNTEEMRALIEWMREYNRTHADDPVEFIGYDMQDPSAPIDSLRAFLVRWDPDLGAVVGHLLSPYREAWRAADYPYDEEPVRRRWSLAADSAYHMVEAASSAWMARARNRRDSADVAWAIQNAAVTSQAARSTLVQDFAVRDSAMAVNLRWALDRRPPRTRAVVWAHDGHISRAGHEWANYWGGGSMGGWLAAEFGEDYRAFGLLTYQGSYSGTVGRDILEVALFPAPSGTLEEALHRVGAELESPLLVTDLRDALADPAAAWLAKPRSLRMIGYAAEDLAFATSIAIAHQFDGVLFVDRTSGSRVLR